MDAQSAHVVAHMIVGGTAALIVFGIGAMILGMLKLVFGKTVPKGENFTFEVAPAAKPAKAKKAKRIFPIQRVLRKTKQPMAEKSFGADWAPVISEDEEKKLRIPTYIRRQRAAAAPMIEAKAPIVVVPPAPAAAAVSKTEVEIDLFEGKDIFQLDPEPAK